jgi:hypothetical protein
MNLHYKALVAGLLGSIISVLLLDKVIDYHRGTSLFLPLAESAFVVYATISVLLKGRFL